MEHVKIDPTGKIYLPKIVRKKIDVKSKYLVVILPDGDVILHKIRKSKNPIRDFQKAWSIDKDIGRAREDILKEALKLAGDRGD